MVINYGYQKKKKHLILTTFSVLIFIYDSVVIKNNYKMQLVSNGIEIKNVVIITTKNMESNRKSNFIDGFHEHRKVHSIVD